MSKLTFKQKSATRKFKKLRSDFYADLSSLLQSTDKKLIDIFIVDAERYEGTARGVLSALWVQRLEDNGADLAKAFEGTLPDEEVSIMAIQQNSGKDAVASALRDMSRIAKLTELVTAETRKTIGAAVVAILIGAGALTLFPIFAVSQLRDALQIPTSAWGSAGRAMASWSETVQTWGIPMVIIVGFLIYSASWSLKHWTGEFRDWADRKMTLNKTVRDLYAIRFLDLMSTLSQKRGNNMQTLKVALAFMAERSPSPWSKWRLGQVLSLIEQTGATTCEVFDTGIVSKEMFWRLRDIEESRGFAAAFEVTSSYASTHLVPRLIKRLVLWRWVMLLTAVAMSATMVFWLQATTGELRNAVTSYMGL